LETALSKARVQSGREPAARLSLVPVGRVIRGDQRGCEFGFFTANVAAPAGFGLVRGQEKFRGLDELIAAVNKDAQEARRYLQTTVPVSDLDRRLGFFR